MPEEVRIKTLLSTLRESVDSWLEVIAEKGLDNDIRMKFKRDLQDRLSGLSCDEWKREVVEWIRDEIVEGERRLGRRVLMVKARLADVGLIGTSVGVLNAALEVGLAWDYIADLPLIPGSAVKGAVRNLLVLRCAYLRDSGQRLGCLESVAKLLGWVESPPGGEVSEIARLLGVKKEDVERVAKKTAGPGLLVFHDAHLLCNEEGGLLEPWVITPHYKGREVRTEYDARPVPVEHVVLARDLEGVFLIGIERSALNVVGGLAGYLGGMGSTRRCEGESCLVFLAGIVAAALESGVGARTSRGYTRFRVLDVGVV